MYRAKHHRSSLFITILWTVVGGFFFLIEWVIRLSNGFDGDMLFTGFTYIIPPLVLGYPFAYLEHSISINRPGISFFRLIIIRVLVYLTGIWLAYATIKHISVNHFYYNVGSYFELKFLIVWGLIVSLSLVFKNALSHFDLKTIRSWLQGEYYLPVTEERILLFIDIDDSTSIAEQLGSRSYFDFLNDFHLAAEESVSRYKGEIFQYVGDEVVVSWKIASGLNNNNAIEVFFDIQDQLKQRRSTFINKYGFEPTIKGAVHMGSITRGELGALKKDFALVGDVLNTTARMYSMCKTKDASFVISRRLLKRFSEPDQYNPVSFGFFKATGKKEEIYVYAISKK